jgi:hypothetical protein
MMLDPTTGFNEAKYRFELPDGQWTAQDQTGLGPDVNDRREMGNDAINEVDPSGLSLTPPGSMIGLSTGGLSSGTAVPGLDLGPRTVTPPNELHNADFTATGTEIPEAGNEVRPFGGEQEQVVGGTVQVFTGVTAGRGKNEITNGIRLQFTSNANTKADQFHWFQTVTRYFLAANGEEIYAGRLSYEPFDDGLTRRTGSDRTYADTHEGECAYYDANVLTQRTADELSIFDRPWHPDELDGVLGVATKSVASFDAYLIYDDSKVVYHVHWESIQDYENGVKVGEPYYTNITGGMANGSSLNNGNPYVVGFDGNTPILIANPLRH